MDYDHQVGFGFLMMLMKHVASAVEKIAAGRFAHTKRSPMPAYFNTNQHIHHPSNMMNEINPTIS
jgi:hypothetical protein